MPSRSVIFISGPGVKFGCSRQVVIPHTHSGTPMSFDVLPPRPRNAKSAKWFPEIDQRIRAAWGEAALRQNATGTSAAPTLNDNFSWSLSGYHREPSRGGKIMFAKQCTSGVYRCSSTSLVRFNLVCLIQVPEVWGDNVPFGHRSQ